MTILANYRDYSTVPLSEYSLTTTPDGPYAEFVFVLEDDGTYYRLNAVIDRDTARTLGTHLLGWVSSGMTSTLEDVYYPTIAGGQLYAAAVDSICELVIKSQPADHVVPISFEMNSDVTIDIGQRLIAFAGADLNAKMEV